MGLERNPLAEKGEQRAPPDPAQAEVKVEEAEAVAEPEPVAGPMQMEQQWVEQRLYYDL